MAFEEAVKRASGGRAELKAPPYFQRALLTPQLAEELLDLVGDGSDEAYLNMVRQAEKLFDQAAEAFFSVPLDRYVVNHQHSGMDWYEFLTCVGHLYVPQHRDMLRSVLRLSVWPGDKVLLP